MNSDLALLERYASERDAEAFAALTERYGSLVYNTALRILNNPHDAEDVAQECFMTLACRAETVRTSLPSWLYCLAVSRAKDLIKKQVRRQHREELKAGRPGADPTWAEVAPVVDEELAALPEELREAILLHFLQRKSQAEMADSLGVSQPTVSRQIKVAVEELRHRLKKRGILIASAALGTMLMTEAAHAVPVSLMATFGKMAVSGIAGTTKATGAVISAKAVASVVVLAGLVTAGGYAVAVFSRAPKPAPPVIAQAPEAPSRVKAAPGTIAGIVLVDSVPAAGYTVAPFTLNQSFPGQPDAQKAEWKHNMGGGLKIIRLEWSMRSAVKTDRDGGFLIKGLAAGEYGLLVTPLQSPFQSANSGASGASEEGHFTTVTKTYPITAAVGIADIEVLLAKPGVISGTVTDESGAPVAGARVFCLSANANDPQQYVYPGATCFAASDAQGRYVFREVPPGTYTLDVSAAGYASPFEPAATHIKAGAVATLDLRLAKEGGF